MALRQIVNKVTRLSCGGRMLHSAPYNIVGVSVMQENSSEYSCDGEKICEVSTIKKCSQEEVGSIVESARAKAFDDSINSVIFLKYEDAPNDCHGNHQA